MSTITLKGSERTAFAGAVKTAPADAADKIEVSVLIRRQSAARFTDHLARLHSGDRTVTCFAREDFASAFGAAAADVAAVRAFATAHGIAVADEHAARRTIVLAGPVARFQSAFGVQLFRMRHAAGTFRGREGPIQIPAALDGIIEAVLGLDDRPQARPHFRLRGAAQAGSTSFTPLQLASLYDFPTATGQGECIALIELGGGYRPKDLKGYFASLNISAPKVTAVAVDHGGNHPTGDPSGPDGEVMLDIEVAGAIAPQSVIAVYFAPNTDAGFLDAVTTAIHDTVHRPSVISISWGSSESTWTSQAMTAMDAAFQDATALGVTVCVASGDNGSSDGVGDGSDHVDFPASSPHALACGGTRMNAAASGIVSEVVWNDGASGGAGGGGVSRVFSLPPWQNGAQATHSGGAAAALSGRGVPDVAGDADPQTGYLVRIDGENTVIGGTSAVAPLWAGLIARINELNKASAGLVQPRLYQNPAALRDVTQGNNGDFIASAGWDACSGLGSPIGAKLLGVL